MTMKKYLALIAIALTSFSVFPAEARDNDHHWDRGNHNGWSKHYDRSHDYYRPLRPYAYRPSRSVVIVNRPVYERETVYVERSPSYYYDDRPYYVSDRYAVGSYAPRNIRWRSLPAYYVERFPAPRHGEHYIYADRDVLLVDSASRVLSALILASAID